MTIAAGDRAGNLLFERAAMMSWLCRGIGLRVVGFFQRAEQGEKRALGHHSHGYRDHRGSQIQCA